MAHSLRRILRFRQLAEEQARLELELAVQSLRRATTAREQQRVAEHLQRIDLADCWAEDAQLRAVRNNDIAATVETETIGQDENSASEKNWLLEEATLEFHGWNRMHLERACEREALRMEPILEHHTERRRELRQTEQLLEQQAKILQVEQGRRAQTETDSWFLGRTLARKRTIQQKERADARDLKKHESHGPAEDP